MPRRHTPSRTAPTTAARPITRTVAILLAVAACADTPTAPTAPTGVAARRALATATEVGMPSATFSSTSGCGMDRSTRIFGCDWSITDLANIPMPSRLDVVSNVTYGYTYECVNTRTGRLQKRLAGGSSNGQTTVATTVSYDSPLPVVGRTDLAITAAPDVCGKAAGVVARLTSVDLTGWGISAVLHTPDGWVTVIGSVEPGPAQP
jgi:hypothetical protein